MVYTCAGKGRCVCLKNGPGERVPSCSAQAVLTVAGGGTPNALESGEAMLRLRRVFLLRAAIAVFSTTSIQLK